MRATAAVLLLIAIPLTGSVLSPSSHDGALEATAFAAASAVPANAPSAAAAAPATACVIVLHALPSADHVALSWTDCPGVESYQVFRGPSAAELVPLVTVNHPSHIDLVEGLVVYAVRAGEGPLSEAVPIARG